MLSCQNFVDQGSHYEEGRHGRSRGHPRSLCRHPKIQLKEHPRKRLITLSFVAGLLLLAGCNTVKGMGQDLQKAGEKIEDAVKK